MEGFTIVDGVAALLVAVSAILAWSRGFLREIMAILGWVAAAAAAFYFAPQAEPLVREIPYAREIIGTSCQLSILAAFAAVFAAALVVMSIFTPLFSAAVQDSPLGSIDRGLGFLFGVARGVLLVVVALIVYQTMGLKLAEIDDSRTVGLLADARDRLQAAIPTEMPDWIETRYNQLLGECGPAPAAPAARTVTPPASQ
ncbi:MAG: colicin V production protein CvpA [Paracoccaceae bacterium]|nr:MAG: CvpA family protein [Alphaproteobacteria bacterium]GIX15122.1 MAG: colicin V production protein CvpA [Paracoccaceae bacterium]